MMPICEVCGAEVDPGFMVESGGLCGECLAEYGFVGEIPGGES